MSSLNRGNALLATRGKGGTLESIKQMSAIFSEDSSLTPASFTIELDTPKAVTLYGGFISYKYDITPEVAYSMRLVIGEYKRGLDDHLADTTAEFMENFAVLESAYNSGVSAKIAQDQFLGKDTTRAVKALESNISTLLPNSYISRENKAKLEAVYARLGSILSGAKVEVLQNA